MILKRNTLWRSSSRTHILKEDYLDQDAEDHLFFKDRYLIITLGNFLQYLIPLMDKKPAK